MSNYKGYLRGVNPNNTRKLIYDEQSFSYESATGSFVNGIGEEVKTLKEAVAKNEKLDGELKQLFPPQKAIGATPVSRHVIHKQIAKKQRFTPSKSFQKIKSEPMNLDFSGLDTMIRDRKEREQINQKLDQDFKKLFKKTDEDKYKGLAGIVGEE